MTLVFLSFFCISLNTLVDVVLEHFHDHFAVGPDSCSVKEYFVIREHAQDEFGQKWSALDDIAPWRHFDLVDIY